MSASVLPANPPPTLAPDRPSAGFRRLALASAVMTYLLVVVGALVRSTGSGMGCPDWPLCQGALVPPLGDTAAWVEWTHRDVAAIVGLLVLALTVAAVVRYRRQMSIVLPAILALFLTGFQAYLGKVTVDTSNAGEWVTAHLVDGPCPARPADLHRRSRALSVTHARARWLAAPDPAACLRRCGGVRADAFRLERDRVQRSVGLPRLAVLQWPAAADLLQQRHGGGSADGPVPAPGRGRHRRHHRARRGDLHLAARAPLASYRAAGARWRSGTRPGRDVGRPVRRAGRGGRAADHDVPRGLGGGSPPGAGCA